MSARDFRDLLVWQKAMDLAKQVYEVSKIFPSAEQFGLTSQIRRSAVSVVSNIAEGQGRETPGDFARFLNIARGSLAELQTQLILAKNLELCDSGKADLVLSSSEEVGRMLRGLRNSLDS